MSSTVASWLFGGWSFGQSPDNANTDHERTKQFGDRTERAADRATDDDRLITQVRAGDATAFEQLFRRYHVPLVEFAASYVGSRDEGGEVVAAFFAWLWEHRATWTATSGVSAYVYGAVRNRALNAIRNRSRDQRRTVTLHALGETPGIATPTLSPAAQVERDDYAAAAIRLIATLPERRRLILSLRWTHELAWDDIAAVLGVTSTAVQKEHSRILAALRAELGAL